MAGGQVAVVRVADMNKNGRLDIILARSEGPHHRLSWFEAPSDHVNGGWTEHIIENSIDYAHSMRVCDINNDGNLDIVVAEMHRSGEMPQPSRKRVMIYHNPLSAGPGWDFCPQPCRFLKGRVAVIPLSHPSAS